MATSVFCLAVILVQPVFRKVGAGEVVLAAVILFGGMVLKNVTFFLSDSTSWNLTDENYRTAGATLVNQLGLTAINVHLGNMISALGWASIALSTSRQSVSAPW